MNQNASTTAALSVPLDRDSFLRSLVRELAGTLEDVVGLEEASGFISVVGQHIGEQIDADYKRALGKQDLDRAEVAEVLVDLKRRIHGDFSVSSRTTRRSCSPTAPARSPKRSSAARRCA